MTERQRKALSTHILKPWTFLDITHRRCTLECKWISWIRHKRVFTLSAPQYKVHMISAEPCENSREYLTLWRFSHVPCHLHALPRCHPSWKPGRMSAVMKMHLTWSATCDAEWQPIPLIMSTVCLSSKIHKYFFFLLKSQQSDHLTHV